MIWKNYIRNGFDMTDSVAIQQWFNLSNVDISTVKRQRIVDNANTHWSKTSRTLESGRLFVFTGNISWETKQERWVIEDLLNSNINIEPFMDTEYLHKLEFITDAGDDRFCYCSVKENLKTTNELHNPRVNFLFELYSPNNAVYDPIENTQSGSSSFFGGTSFPNKFGDSRWAFAGGASCDNQWNWKTWCLITVVWSLVNPLIKNITNWLQYKLNWTVNNLELDSRELWREVTSWWVDISSQRDYWEAILLSSGTNLIWIFADSWTATFTVKRHSARNTI